MSEYETKRLSRLTAILTHLQTKRLLTASELAGKFAVSVRTIYRDIKALEHAGVPILTEEGRGYTLMEGYRIPPVMFTESEANALITAEQLILKNKDASFVREYSEAIGKIKSVLRNNTKDKANLLAERIVFRQNANNNRTSNYLSVLQLALTNFNLVKIKYHTPDTEQTTERTIEPFAIYSTQDNWLLIALCRLRKDFRAFRLDRIQTLTVLNEHFEPQKMTLQEYFEICKEKYSPPPDIGLSQAGNMFVAQQKTNYKMQHVNIEPFQVIGISVRTTNENSQAIKDITDLWGKFMNDKVLDTIPNKIDDTVYCIYTDYESDHTRPYTTILGCRVASLATIPEGMVSKTIEGGKYVQLSARGDLMQGLIGNKWREIWGMDLDRRYTADYEVFGEKAQNPINAEVDFLIAVK